MIPLWEMRQLIHDGGEELGQLIEIRLAVEVLGSTLVIIKSDKGKTVLNKEILGRGWAKI